MYSVLHLLLLDWELDSILGVREDGDDGEGGNRFNSVEDDDEENESGDGMNSYMQRSRARMHQFNAYTDCNNAIGIGNMNNYVNSITCTNMNTTPKTVATRKAAKNRMVESIELDTFKPRSRAAGTSDNESFCFIMDDDSDDAFGLTAFQSKTIGGRADSLTPQFTSLVVSEDVTPVSVHYLQSALIDLKRRLNLKEGKNQVLEQQIRELQEQLNYAMARLSETGNGSGYNGSFQNEAAVAQGAAAQEAVVPESKEYVTRLSQSLDFQKGRNRTLEAEIVALHKHNEELTLKLKHSSLDLKRVKLECDNYKENDKTVVDLQSKISSLTSQLKVKNKELEEKTRLLENTTPCSVAVSKSQDVQNRGLSLHIVPGGSLPMGDVTLSSNGHAQNIGQVNSAEQQKIDDEVEKCCENFRHLQEEVDKQSVIARYIDACCNNISDDDNVSISSVSSADEASSALSSDFFFTAQRTESSNVPELEHAKPIDYHTNQILQTNKGMDEITYGVNKLNVDGERPVPIHHLAVRGHQVLRGGGNETFSQGSSPNIVDLYGRVEANLHPVEHFPAIQHPGTTKKTVERTRSSQVDNRSSPVRRSPRQRNVSDVSQVGGQNHIPVPAPRRNIEQIPTTSTNVMSQSAVNQPIYVNQHAHQQPARLIQTVHMLDNRIGEVDDARYQALRTQVPQSARGTDNISILRRTPLATSPPPIPKRQPAQCLIGPPPRPTEPPQQHIIMSQQAGRPSVLSASPSALPTSLSVLSAQRQDMLAPQVCPICKQDFTLLSMGDFQTHVFDCYDNEDADGHQPSTLLAIPIPETEDQRKVCPMCNNLLPAKMSQDEFERHVNGHFEPDFEMVNMPS